MGRIRQMDDGLATLIAAGEVITGPAAVVRELVDNALDAGASTVEVRVEEGGLRRIRVADDGCGMDAADAALCLSRHATSKIAAAEDLEEIGTLGFRGEALASILAVARLQIETSVTGGEGSRVAGAAGALLEVGAVARRRGTTIEVSRLFHNTPARREYQDTPRAELGRVLQAVQRAALAHPGVRFSLHEGSRELLDLLAAPDLLERIRQLHGAEFADALLPVSATRGEVCVTGFVSHPAAAVRRARRNAFAVNGRPFESFEVRRILANTFSPQLTGGAHVEAILHVSLPRRDVDVNVSPDKSQVRFRRPGQVFAAVHDALQAALGEQEALVRIGAASAPHAEHPEPRIAPAAAGPAPLLLPLGARAPRHRLPPEPPAILQLHDTYLVCPSPDGLLIVDQHAAHERVHYERLRERLRRLGRNPDVQSLVFPEPLRLDPAQVLLLREMEPVLRRLGFDLVAAGPREMLVQGTPAALGRRSAARTLQRLMEQYADGRDRGLGAGASDDQVAAIEERLLHTVACHSAVRAGQPLSEAERRALWAALCEVELAGHDVHGRPALLLLEVEEITRRMGRALV